MRVGVGAGQSARLLAPVLVLVLLAARVVASPETYNLWLNYQPLPAGAGAAVPVRQVVCNNATSESPLTVACDELALGLSTLLGVQVPVSHNGVHPSIAGPVVSLGLAAGTAANASPSYTNASSETEVFGQGSNKTDEASTFGASPSSRCTALGRARCFELTSRTGRGVLFGTFRVLALLQVTQP
jgi:hypothetical protein